MKRLLLLPLAMLVVVSCGNETIRPPETPEDEYLKITGDERCRWYEEKQAQNLGYWGDLNMSGWTSSMPREAW